MYAQYATHVGKVGITIGSRWNANQPVMLLTNRRLAAEGQWDESNDTFNQRRRLPRRNKQRLQCQRHVRDRAQSEHFSGSMSRLYGSELSGSRASELRYGERKQK